MSEERPKILWDRAKLNRFKKAVAKAADDTLMFEGHEFVVAYAKYLIIYLDATLYPDERT